MWLLLEIVQLLEFLLVKPVVKQAVKLFNTECSVEQTLLASNFPYFRTKVRFIIVLKPLNFNMNYYSKSVLPLNLYFYNCNKILRNNLYVSFCNGCNTVIHC